ncbi:MAG: hypothetical protein KA257_13455 [Opitutaceae bacterium]|nr:hypothetical protein [Opitutaceae bacterium]MBP9913472.1 hypothetical protein [Opitutaceae bacterium]
MNIRYLLSVALFVSSLSFAGAADEPKSAKDKEVTELGEQMDHLSAAFRKLRRQAGDAAKNESSLGYVAEMQAATAKALTLVPAKAADLPAGKRPKFEAGYHKQMEKFIKALNALEAALKAGDNAGALKLVSELGSLQKAGHKEYKKPEKE